MIAQCHRIDLLFRDEKQDLVPAFVERLRDGEAREEMPPGAAAGDDELFGYRHVLENQMRGTERPARMTWRSVTGATGMPMR
jgi:hypothetical protein